MKRYIFFALILTSALLLSSMEIPVEHLVLKGKAKISDGILQLDGENSYAEIPGTESWNITEEGLTLACSVKFNDSKSFGESPEALDGFFGKGENTPFVFARYGGKIYTNIRNSDDNRFSTATRTHYTAKKGEWTHFAVVFSHYDEHEQGDIGYWCKVYINGTPVTKIKHSRLTPTTVNGLLHIGRAWGGPWFFNGEITEINVERRAFADGEIMALTDKSKLVKIKSGKLFNPDLIKYKPLSSAGKWLLQALHRLPHEQGDKLAKKNRKAWQIADDVKFLKSWQKENRKIRLLMNKNIAMIVNSSPAAGLPLLGFYDLYGRRPVMEDKLFGWRVNYVLSGKNGTVSASTLPCKIENLSESGFTAIWQSSGKINFTAKSKFVIFDDGISADLQIDNNSENLLLKEAVFPEVRIPHIGKNDVLFYPFQCGAEIKNPTESTFKHGQTGVYPSASMTMQYIAYYGNGRGVFLGWQDPHGGIKTIQVSGKRHGLEANWTLPVKIPLTKVNGGNSFRSPGNVVFKVYSGNWYEAALLHKKWALQHAEWKNVPYPRKDTPQWFRDVPLSLAVRGKTEETAMQSVNMLSKLQKYFDTPIYALWFMWYENSVGWPNFPAWKFMPKMFDKIRSIGCYTEPYTDGRLWNGAEARFKTLGKPNTVKLDDGTIPQEIYEKGAIYYVMCPATGVWQNELLKIADSVKPYSSAFYYDQVMASRPWLCFDPAHGHSLNDPQSWITHGFRPAFKTIRQKYPDIPLVSEEVSEPYIDFMDGGHVWRWTFDGQVPAFQAVYGGRLQYMALIYDKIGKGEYSSNFVKMGSSLVNGLQIGRMEVSEFFNADNKRKFCKKMTAMRFALKDYFNAGTMLSPLKFLPDLPLQTTNWSTSGYKTEAVTMPAVVSNSYTLGVNSIYIFVNTSNSLQTISPLNIKGKLCIEGSAKPVLLNNSFKLAPYNSAVVIDGNETEVLRLHKVMKKISTFDEGKPFDRIFTNFPDRKTPLPVKPGDILEMESTIGYFNCSPTEDFKYFAQMNEPAFISYGTVDFGKEKVENVRIYYAVPEKYSGGKIELLLKHSNGEIEHLCTHKCSGSGGWNKFKETAVKLKRKITGSCHLLFRFDRTGCCNFKGWGY